MGISKSPSPAGVEEAEGCEEEGSLKITSFAMQPPSQVLKPWDETKIRSRLKECDSILFAAYRTSTKLAVLQEALKLNLVKLNLVTNVFQHHGLGPWENESLLSEAEVSGVIRDLYFAGSKVRNYYSPSLNVEGYAVRAKGILEEIYGPQKYRKTKSLKTFLVVLCDGVLRDKLIYLFRQFAHSNSNHCLTRDTLRSLLSSLAKFPEYFQESRSFGPQWIPSALDSCFKFTRSDLDALNEQIYLKWQLMEPQLLVWLPTFYRQTSAKGIRHGIRCSNCRTQDIIGMRYQCLRCLNYDTCQHCFFYGHVSRSHKIQHPMQEYCYKSSRRDETLAFLKKLANNFRKRNSRDVRGRYLPASYSSNLQPCDAKRQSENAQDSHDGSSGFHSDSSEQREASPTADIESTVIRRKDDNRIVISRQKRNEVKSIIMNLEEHNEKRILSADETEVQVSSVREQLNRLKVVMESLFGDGLTAEISFNGKNSDKSIIGSTPLSVASSTFRKRSHNDVDKFSNVNISPISIKQRSRLSESEEDAETFTKRELSRYADLSTVSMGDISTFLSKTGNVVTNLNDLNITNRLLGAENLEEDEDGDEDVLNELESLMTRLENVFKSFEEPSFLASNSSSRHHKGLNLEIGQLVAEIGDQLHAFNHNSR